MVEAARRFRHLVKTRNAMAHGKPGHTPDGRHTLVHEGRPWTLDGIRNAERMFVECANRLENLLNGPLRKTAR